MSTRVGNPIADDFLRRVERASRGLPTDRRAELLDDLEAHLRDAVVEADGSEARLRTLVDSLGSVEEIVAAAGPPEPRRRLAGRDLLAIILLLLGGFLFVVGWLAGVVLLWASPAWTWRQKLLGTLVFPGGLLGIFILVGLGPAQTCSSFGPIGGRPAQTHCTGTALPDWLAILILVILLVGPVVTAVYLALTGREPEPV